MAHAQLSDRKFVLTGPSGWIGQAVLSRLCATLGSLSGRVAAFASSERSMTLADGQSIPVRALDTLCPDDVDGAHVIHLAYLTKEKADTLGERRFTDTNISIDDYVLAAMRDATPLSLFVASSGAAALAARGDDLHPYGLTKLRQEVRFLEWAAARAVPMIAGRIYNLSGPYINKIHSYAVSNFISQARTQRRIKIEAKNPVFRSYLHVENLSELVINAAIAGAGRPGAVDLCGAEVLEMQDLAELVSSICDEVPIEREMENFTKVSNYLGSFPETKSVTMETGVRLHGIRQQVLDTLRWISLLDETQNLAKNAH
jgi:nucleoside-diphosphate-sugar epimerase